VLSYRVMLDVPVQLALFVARLLAAHCREIGTRRGTRALTAWQQAVFARYLDEAITVLATRAPALREAVERAGEEIISRKGKEIDRWYSGKAHGFGGNIQALFTPDGIPLWVCAGLPGGVHDITAAREPVLAAAGIAAASSSATRTRWSRSSSLPTMRADPLMPVNSVRSVIARERTISWTPLTIRGLVISRRAVSCDSKPRSSHPRQKHSDHGRQLVGPGGACPQSSW
jgi:hypothetical protein